MKDLERFEFVASAFYADTHMLRPGKSQPMACNGTPSDEERAEAWKKWSTENERLINCFIRAHDEIFGEES